MWNYHPEFKWVISQLSPCLKEDQSAWAQPLAANLCISIVSTVRRYVSPSWSPSRSQNLKGVDEIYFPAAPASMVNVKGHFTEAQFNNKISHNFLFPVLEYISENIILILLFLIFSTWYAFSFGMAVLSWPLMFTSKIQPLQYPFWLN